MSDAPLWERQPWDTNASYRAFKDFYLPESEPGRLIKAYRRFQRQKGVKKASKNEPTKVPGSWSNWNRGCGSDGKPIEGAVSWAERAAAFDEHVDRQQLQKLAEAKVKSKEQRRRVAEGALAQLTIVWSQMDFRPKVGADGRITSPELPPFRDAVAALKTVLNEVRIEYGDLPAQQVKVEGDVERPLVHKFDLSGLPLDVLHGLVTKDGPPDEDE